MPQSALCDVLVLLYLIMWQRFGMISSSTWRNIETFDFQVLDGNLELQSEFYGMISVENGIELLYPYSMLFLQYLMLVCWCLVLGCESVVFVGNY